MKFKNFVDADVNEYKKTEFESYLEDRVLPDHESFDILGWWKANQYKYALLSKIARDILVILVSTVASESTFSAAGRVVSLHRNRLHPNTVEALMCTQSWLRNDKRLILTSIKNVTSTFMEGDIEDFKKDEEES
ncbi:Zinc finger BED domain-containing protein RICESLEEPER [Melia azedarach]|uniref:Zinc finger BED domain-containing protein RICESLEEPER n=1 Tax=Melia azedarach TaxID=155640 RepID=A0ACC1Y1K6_MELAZ|nr:Zinc finger BED domain-containing protein RICESLEEPER [Melia azedarach]